jgi:Na+-driven multidrug efflux pump
MIFPVVAVWGMQILPGYVLVETLGWGTDGAWVAIAFMHVGAAVLATAWFATGSWTDNVVEEDEDAPVATPAD